MEPTPATPATPTAPPSVAPARPAPPAEAGQWSRPQTKPRRTNRHPGAIARDLALAICIPTIFVVAFGLYQSMFPQRIVSAETPADYGLAFEDVRLTTADGLHLVAWYVPPKQGDGKSAILVLHGYPADKGDLLGRASFLAERHALLFLDFRYFGGSEGAYTTAGVREVEDALAAIAYLKTRGAERIGIYGFSLGGAVALMTTDRTTEVAAIAAEAPYATLRLAAEEPYKYLGPLQGPLAAATAFAAGLITGVDVAQVSPLRAVARSRVPTLLIHSRADQVVPFKNAELLWSAMGANPEAESLFFDDLPHGAASFDFARIVNDFFLAHLSPPSP